MGLGWGEGAGMSAVLTNDGRAWLVRVPEVFAGVEGEVLAGLGAVGGARLGQEFQVIKVAGVDAIRKSEAGLFVQWNLPLEHTWPCHPASAAASVARMSRSRLLNQ